MATVRPTTTAVSVAGLPGGTGGACPSVVSATGPVKTVLGAGAVPTPPGFLTHGVSPTGRGSRPVSGGNGGRLVTGSGTSDVERLSIGLERKRQTFCFFSTPCGRGAGNKDAYERVAKRVSTCYGDLSCLPQDKTLRAVVEVETSRGKRDAKKSAVGRRRPHGRDMMYVKCRF